MDGGAAALEMGNLLAFQSLQLVSYLAASKKVCWGVVVLGMGVVVRREVETREGGRQRGKRLKAERKDV